MLVLLAVPAMSLLFLQNRQVQTMVSRFFADRLSAELKTSITLSSVHYSFFKRIQVRDLYIEDLHGDTLLFSELTKLRIRQIRPERNGIEIRKITMENAYVNFVIDSSQVLNLKFITDRLVKPHVPPEKKVNLNIHSFELLDSRFSLSNMIKTEGDSGVNFTDLDLGDLYISIEDLTSSMDTVRMNIVELTGIEKSGFQIADLESHLSLGKRHLYFTDLGIVTEKSDIHIPELGFNFSDYSKFKHFSYEVDLQFSSLNSTIALSDLSAFVPLKSGFIDRVTIDGKLKGKLSDLRGEDLFLTFDQNSSLAFDFVMIGLPDFNNTFMDFNFRELNSSVDALTHLGNSGKDPVSQSVYPWTNLGNLNFAGNFTGYPDQFVASGLLVTDIGKMVMDLSFKPDSLLGLDFSGRLRTTDFKLGVFLDREEVLSGLDMNIYTDGNLYRGEINADMTGTVDTLELYKYAYSNITLDGTFTNNLFIGGFSISDPNIRMDFNGKMDFSGETPVYAFTADVARARPYFLNLPQSDPNYFASFLIETDLSGHTIDDLNGELTLVNSLFEKTDAQVQLYDLTIKTRNNSDASLIQVRSDLFDADITGHYKLSGIPAAFRNLADKYLDILPDSTPEPDTLNYFVYNLDFKRINPLLDFFYPAIQIGDRSTLEGIYDPVNSDIRMNAEFPYLQVTQNHWHNASINSEMAQERWVTRFSSDSMTFGDEYSLIDQRFLLEASNDTASLDITWDNRTQPRYSGEIKLQGTFSPDSGQRSFNTRILPTDLLINDEPWEVNSASVILGDQFITIDSFAVTANQMYIIANGTISSREDQDFTLEVGNLNLNGLAGLSGMNMDLEGNITGNINYQQMESYRYILADLSVDTLYFNEQLLGPTNLDAIWNESKGNINMQLISQVDGKRLVDVDGDFTPESELLDFDIILNEFDLSSFDPYSARLANDLAGTANINMTLDGTLKKPELNGSIVLNNAAATISVLNTRYIFNDRIRVYKNNLYLEDFMIYDEMGNKSLIDGTITSNHLKDFYLTLNIEADNMLCLNTRSVDNQDFYGTIFATGNVGINGGRGGIKLAIDAITQRNTAVFLPLYNASEVQTTDFITFVREIETDEEPTPVQDQKFGGLEMELEVEITPDAVVQLIFDPKVGDIIETSGRGDLRMILDPSSGFSIFGDVELQKGDYLFTLQNVINKRFLIEPGGKIYFNGSPSNTTIDLDAIYTTRTAPYNLYPGGDAPESLKKRIPVECHLNLQGELESPTISMAIEMPTADPRTKDFLENSTSTEEELMKQFLSLLVINNFYSVTGFGAQDVGIGSSSLAGVTASELFSNQLSNWLSQISDDFDIGVNYRPGDQISSDEVEVALSTQLLDDRIIISGNLDVGGQETNPTIGDQSNPYIVGDFDVEFRITDNVSIIAFNRARDELIFETAPYKQGVGISYREEFDELTQLLNRYREGLTNRKKRKKKTEEPRLDD